MKEDIVTKTIEKIEALGQPEGEWMLIDKQISTTVGGEAIMTMRMLERMTGKERIIKRLITARSAEDDLGIKLGDNVTYINHKSMWDELL